jgi:hypothetical protein
MEQRLARLERHSQMWLDAMVPVFKSLDRSLKRIYADDVWQQRNPRSWEELKRAEVVRGYRSRQEDERLRAERLRSAWLGRRRESEDGEEEEDVGSDVEGGSRHCDAAERTRGESRCTMGSRPGRQDGVVACGSRTPAGWPIRHGVKNSLPSDFGAEFAGGRRMVEECGDWECARPRVRRISGHMEHRGPVDLGGLFGRRAVGGLDTLEPLMRELVGGSGLALGSQAESLSRPEASEVEYQA